MMSVRWESLDPATYERFVCTLLSLLHPKIQRIDGTGGDGGRDAQFEDSTGLVIWEMKSFTGRVGRTRRRQVERSIARAAALEPVRWHLVVPIDPTPAEEAWFSALRRFHPAIELEWIGRTWLDARAAQHPELIRYFFEDGKSEVIELLRELREEQAAISDVNEAVARFVSLHERLNEIDPYYRYELTTGATNAEGKRAGSVLSVTCSGLRIDVMPRYRSALSDRPITVAVTVRFGPEHAALRDAFSSAMDFGQPIRLPADVLSNVTIDAPGGLGGTFPAAEMEIASIPGQPDIAISLDIYRKSQLLCSLPLTGHHESSGTRGGVITAKDKSGWLNAKLTLDRPTKRLRLNCSLHGIPGMPNEWRPVLRWLRHFETPNELVIRMTGSVSRQPIPKRLVHQRAIETYEALGEIQDMTSTYFEVDPRLSKDDAIQIFGVRDLLRGDAVPGTWSAITITLRDDANPESFAQLSAPEGTAVIVEADERWSFRGHDIPLGRVRQSLESARIANLGDDRTVTLEPAGSRAFRRQLVSNR